MDSRNTDGRTALITGASTGIGRACALYLDARGFRVFAGVRKESDAKALREAASERLKPVIIDVTDEAGIAAAAETVDAALDGSGLDGLVNNAGVVVAGPLEFVPVAGLRRQLEINVLGQVAVTQAFLPMLRQGRGRIVNMGSISGRVAFPFLGPYAASKFALEALSDAMRVELAPAGIKVALLEPGVIITPLWDKSRAMADEMAEALPERGRQLYGGALTVMRRKSDELARHGIPPERVARVVFHALTARRPKTRYVVGMDAKLQAALIKLIPDKVVDWLILRFLRGP